VVALPRSLRRLLRALGVALALVATMAIALPAQALGRCDECAHEDEAETDDGGEPCDPSSGECEDCTACHHHVAIRDLVPPGALALPPFVIARDEVLARAPEGPGPRDILVVPRR
jgi:hypothetical protein